MSRGIVDTYLGRVESRVIWVRRMTNFGRFRGCATTWPRRTNTGQIVDSDGTPATPRSVSNDHTDHGPPIQPVLAQPFSGCDDQILELRADPTRRPLRRPAVVPPTPRHPQPDIGLATCTRSDG